MKRTLLAIGLVLCCTLGAQAASKSYTFTGFCDGISLSTNSNDIAMGYHLNNNCAGANSILSGVKGKIAITPESAAGGTAIEVSDEDFLYPLFNNTGFWVIDETHLTWALYGDVGSGLEVLNYGTLTVGAPEQAIKQGTTYAAAAGKAQPQVYSYTGIPGVYSFTFTGFCDGMVVSLYGQLAEGKHVLDGCGLGDSVVSGSLDTSKIKPPDSATSLVVAVHDSFLVGPQVGFETGFYVLDLVNATWAGYSNEGSGVKLFNSGTLTNGAPAGPVKNGATKASFQK